MSGRRRSAFAILLCVCAACAAEPVSRTRGGFDVPHRDYGAVTPTPESSPTVGAVAGRRDDELPRAVEAAGGLDPAAEERLLREELAAPGDPTEPALDLAGYLCGRERFDEALAVVEIARGRSADPRLRIARAGLLRDLGRRTAAAGELRSIVRERGARDLHPSLLLEWAELEWLNADFAAAREALAELARAHGEDPWAAEHRRDIDRVAAAVARDQRASPGVRDLLGDLRGEESVARRAAAFDGLAVVARLQGDDAAELLDRIVTIAFDDVAAELRTRAVDLASAGSPLGPAVLAAALADADPAVRMMAARRAFSLDREGAATALLDRMAKENDAGVFVVVHQSLAANVANAPALPDGGGTTVESRATVVAAWRERCGR